MSLKIVQEQIYNPTNDWMSCTLGNNNSKLYISPIPPRSTRPLPMNITSPEIVSESVLSASSVAKFTTSTASAQSSIVMESLELNFQGEWKGEAQIADAKHSIVSIACIREKDIMGWFSFDSVIYFFIGNLNTLTRSATFTVYESVARKRSDLRGSIVIDKKSYSIEGKSSDLSFALTIDQDKVSSIEEDKNITGQYLGYYEKSPHSFEIRADMTVFTSGIVTGRGTEESRQFTIFGMVDYQKKLFFFIRLKGNDITYYNGEAQLESEIYFDGCWKFGTNKGGFTLIRNMENK